MTPTNRHRSRLFREEPEPRARSAFDELGTFLVRLVGIGVMLFGIVSVYLVINTVWDLFDDQTIVTKVSTEIEERSGLGAYMDDGLHQFTAALDRLAEKKSDAKAALASDKMRPDEAPAARSAGSVLRGTSRKTPYAYVFAWVLVIAMLGLISRIGLGALTHGAKLAIIQRATGSEQTEELVREFAAELRRMNDRS